MGSFRGKRKFQVKLKKKQERSIHNGRNALAVHQMHYILPHPTHPRRSPEKEIIIVVMLVAHLEGGILVCVRVEPVADIATRPRLDDARPGLLLPPVCRPHPQPEDAVNGRTKTRRGDAKGKLMLEPV